MSWIQEIRRRSVKRGMKAIFTCIVCIVVGLSFMQCFAVATAANKEAFIAEKRVDPLVEKGIDLRVDLAKNLFQLTLLIAGALWAETILKLKSTSILVGWQNKLIFTVASGCLLFSFFAHLMYLDRVSTAYYDAGGNASLTTDLPASVSAPALIPDVFGPYMSLWFDLQSISLRAAFVVTVTCFLSGYFLSEGKE